MSDFSNIQNKLRWDYHGLHNFNQIYNYNLFFAKELNNIKRNIFYDDANYDKLKPRLDIINRFRLNNKIEKCDYVLVPHPWIVIKNNFDYLRYLNNLSHLVPLIIVNTDDMSPRCDLPNTLQIRTFLHPREKMFRKIVFPYPAKSQEFVIRSWRKVPQVSFIGYVPKFTFGTLTSKSSSFLYSPVKSSVYINRKITVYKLNKLKAQFNVILIKRNQFTLSLNNSNLTNDIDIYKSNLANSDYIVCPRGFGNTSIRFYETLSSGATPVLIESGSPLPIVSANKFWDQNILKLGIFSNWSREILNDWDSLKYGDRYAKRQFENNKVFENELHIQKYTEKIFERYFLNR
jgi:hypothetical protein